MKMKRIYRAMTIKFNNSNNNNLCSSLRAYSNRNRNRINSN